MTRTAAGSRPRGAPADVVDELARRAAGAGVVATAPEQGLGLLDLDAPPPGQMPADAEVQILVGGEEQHPQPETVGQRDLLLEGVRHMDLASTQRGSLPVGGHLL